MKRIETQSNFHKFKLCIEQNFLFRILKLILNPKKLYFKISKLKKKKKKYKKIDWGQRVAAYGRHAVIDTQTPKNEFNYVTNLQKKILLGNLKKFTSGREKKILDFGCGSGRFSKSLLRLNKKASGVAADREKKLIEIAKPSKRIKYLHFKHLKQIKSKFDIIFVANVLGGIKKRELKMISSFFKSKLNKNGILLLNENIDNSYSGEKNFSYWIARSEKFYINLFKDLSLKKVDEYSYLQNSTSIFIGKK